MRIALLLCLTCLTSMAWAKGTQEGILVKQVPLYADMPSVVAAIRQAFVVRHWTIESEDETSVTARLQHNRIDVRMRIAMTGSQLTYEQFSNRIEVISNPAQSALMGGHPASIKRWRAMLQRDIERSLAGLPKPPTKQTASQ